MRMLNAYGRAKYRRLGKDTRRPYRGSGFEGRQLFFAAYFESTYSYCHSILELVCGWMCARTSLHLSTRQDAFHRGTRALVKITLTGSGSKRLAAITAALPQISLQGRFIGRVPNTFNRGRYYLLCTPSNPPNQNTSFLACHPPNRNLNAQSHLLCIHPHKHTRRPLSYCMAGVLLPRNSLSRCLPMQCLLRTPRQLWARRHP